jgi:ribosomal protein L31E
VRAEIVGLISVTSGPEVQLTHDGESINFSASCFGRTNFDQGYGVFDHLNKYWESFSKEEQAHIFSIYRDMMMLFGAVISRTELTIELNKKVVELVDFHDFERAYQWVLFESDIAVPSNFDTEYVHSVDRQGSREQTYIRSDYTKLITLALVLRTLVPIWGEFIARTRQESGTTFKEYYAFQLLNRAKILQSEPYQKLIVYIDRTVGDDRSNPSTIIEGISSEDFPRWMMALVVIRRLSTGDIRGIDARANMVTYIHKYVTAKMKGSDIAADNMVKEKLYDDGGGDIESKLSSLERYKIKHDISQGEITELEYIISDYRRIAYLLSSNMTEELLNRCIESAKILETHDIIEPQITVLRWVFKKVISPRGLMYLDKSHIVRAMGVLQAVLWARGHKYLSLLTTSHILKHDDYIYIGNTDSRQRITKDMQAELDRLYPYFKTVGGKKTGLKPLNLATRSIEMVADNFSMFTWSMTADEEMIKDAFGNCNSRRIQVPSDIKIRLARLVIEIGNHQWS